MTRSTASRLHPPVFHRLERLAGDVELIDVGDADQDDRQIAGYAQRPQTRLPTAPALDGLRRRAQRGRGVDEVPGQTLVLPGLARGRCRGGAIAPGLASRRARRRARRRRRRGACRSDRGSPARDEATIVQKSIRAVAPGAIRTRRRRANIGSSTAPVVPESGRPLITAPRRANAAAAAEEPRAIGLELALARRPRHRQPPGARPRPAAPSAPAAASSPLWRRGRRGARSR